MCITPYNPGRCPGLRASALSGRVGRSSALLHQLKTCLELGGLTHQLWQLLYNRLDHSGKAVQIVITEALNHFNKNRIRCQFCSKILIQIEECSIVVVETNVYRNTILESSQNCTDGCLLGRICDGAGNLFIVQEYDDLILIYNLICCIASAICQFGVAGASVFVSLYLASAY